MDEDLSSVSKPIAKLATLIKKSPAIVLVEWSDISIDFLIGVDLAGRATLLADEQTVVLDLFVSNSALLTGPVREGLVSAALLLNHSAQRGRKFALALDERDYLVLFDRKSVSKLFDSALESWMQYLADQAVQVRELVAELTLEEYEGGIEYGFQTAEEM